MEPRLNVPSLTTMLRLALALECKGTELTCISDQTDLAAILPK
jgi:hypothetical protein